MSDIDKNSIVISKVIQTMEDFHSVLKLVEEKLQESSNFLFLMLENTEKDEEYFDEFSEIFNKEYPGDERTVI